jgi:hypothetical protein
MLHHTFGSAVWIAQIIAPGGSAARAPVLTEARRTVLPALVVACRRVSSIRANANRSQGAAAGLLADLEVPSI